MKLKYHFNMCSPLYCKCLGVWLIQNNPLTYTVWFLKNGRLQTIVFGHAGYVYKKYVVFEIDATIGSECDNNIYFLL